MHRTYPGKSQYVTLTANVILRSNTHKSFSCYFGQSFGAAKSVYFGQQHDAITGGVRQLFTEFVVRERADLQQLPINFTVEDFAGIYKRNFANSEVTVHRVLSLVYIFSVGLDKYQTQHTLERRPVRIF